MCQSRKSILENDLPSPGPAGGDRPAALYVHVPLCRKRCHYCDFFSTTDRTKAPGLIDAMLAELAAKVDTLQLPLKTVFVGGGTPTALPADLLKRLLEALGRLTDERTEFSVEANCNSLSPETAGVLRDGGVNRLSLGVQSFDDEQLRLLGRLHSAAEARTAIETAREFDFVNLSLDLIYGIPGQSLESWRQSLTAAIDAGVAHLSCYCLDYPEGTELARRLHEGRIETADEELQLACYHLARRRCAEAGLAHYEISNFAAGDRRCRHNLNYWHNGAYAAVGPGAVGCIDGLRVKNVCDIDAYLARVSAGADAADADTAERLGGRMKLAESIMLGLRLIEGIDRRRFAARYGADPAEAFPRSVERHVAGGLLVLDADRMRLAEEALFVSDGVLADFIAEAAD